MRPSNKGCDSPNCGCDDVHNCDAHEIEVLYKPEGNFNGMYILLGSVFLFLIATAVFMEYYNKPQPEPKCVYLTYVTPVGCTEFFRMNDADILISNK